MKTTLIFFGLFLAAIPGPAQQTKAALRANLSSDIDQMQATLKKWKADATAARGASPKGKFDAHYGDQLAAWRAQHSKELQSIFADALTLRGELLAFEPQDFQDANELSDDAPLVKGATGRVVNERELQVIIDQLQDAEKWK